ncbi:MAG: D-hexose-6-phosphate mutarotase, partial [Verrucomicrobia bacterium]|nr:D-hexose-6-phosphate mutarotase [Verrucomicrobiota bacterium]
SPEDLGFENCLHTYFAVGDITRVSICGLQGLHYLDKAGDAGGARKLEAEPELRITRETNRVYVNATGAVEIRDETFRRKIVVEKSNSASTVVWNPWTTQKMPDDFAAGEYQRMVCVESGNVAENRLTLAPGQTSNLKVTLSTGAL